VKHRIGIDRHEDYGFVRDFVGSVADAGCEVFIVHARNAWLKGLSPKENRELPPLRHDFVHRLKRELPRLTIVLNGGIADDADIATQLQHVDGVMVGRQAYHAPWSMARWDSAFLGLRGSTPTREEVAARWLDYLERIAARGVPWSRAMRHALGLWNGVPGARVWRQRWSDHRLQHEPPRRVAALAAEALRTVATVESLTRFGAFKEPAVTG
jgi:tRNA-dihydrouridine synthase A